jgi:hypothetical protein
MLYLSSTACAFPRAFAVAVMVDGPRGLACLAVKAEIES